MARKIIIQERINEPSDFSFRYVFWASVPTARQLLYANPNKTSIVRDVTAGELTAIKNGEILEFQGDGQYIAGTPIATIQADLISKFNSYQTRVNNLNPWRYYGTSWDGTSWEVKQTA